MVNKLNLLFLFLLFSISFSSAWTLNGTAYNVNGNRLNNTQIIVNIGYFPGGTPPSYLSPNTTSSDENGNFNLSVYDNSSYQYQITLRHTNSTTGAVDFVGQSLPYFPYLQVSGGINTNFYLKPAGTINISAINRTGANIGFGYQVKDTQLGYTIDSNFSGSGGIKYATIYVPTDRNYSIMIYPSGSMPLTFNWNNFTSASSYGFGTNDISTYNYTTKVVNKIFNTTSIFASASGYLNATSVGVAAWESMIAIPYLLQPGNMVFMNDAGWGSLPFNMSAWNSASDFYNITDGFYNITLPGPEEEQTILLFFTAKNGSNFGAFRNVTVSISTSQLSNNITMYGLLGNLVANLTLQNAADPSPSATIKAETKKQVFYFTNSSSNATIVLPLEAHVEIDVDYSNYGAREFTFMADASSGANNFSIPLLNMTGVKEINVFTQNFAPKRVSTKTANQIISNNNISLGIFNPQALDGTSGSSISIIMYKSNSTCDVPSPSAGCILGSPTDGSAFNPISTIMGGGKISFRMSLNNVSVHYVNVDMLASGPPDALFEDNADVNETRTNGFGKIMRFGSEGPKIYDYVLVSMPYTEGSSSQAGLNESASVNLSIPVFYDENWNIIWNSTTNSTNMDRFAGNYSHYSTRKTEWESLANETICTINASIINRTTPCYIDTDANKIWVRLPHFSGTGPLAEGDSVNDTTNPRVTDVTENDVGTTSALVTWITDENANSSVKFGTTKSLTDGSNRSTSLVTSHSLKIQGLDADTLYYYNVTSCDSAGNCNRSGAYSFTTDATDSGDGGDDGSGGALTGWVNVASPTEAQVVNGFTKTLAVLQRVKMIINGTNHYVGPVKITSSKVTINVSSSPQQAVFSKGDEKKFDVTNDSYYDIKVKLNGMNNSLANITITSIRELINQSSGSNNLTGGINQTSGNQTVTNRTGSGINLNLESLNKPWVWVVVILVIVLVMVLIVYWNMYGNPFKRIREANKAKKLMKM